MNSNLLPPAIACCLLAVACADPRLPQHELTGITMGTTYSVKLVAPPENLDSGDIHREIDALLTRIEGSMSTYLADSDLSRVNASRSTDWIEVAEELCAAVADAQSVSQFTNGAFDITIGPLVNLWGFGPDGTAAVPAGLEEIAAAKANVGFTRLRADCARPALQKEIPELYVDLSAYAKGYAVDRVAELLDASAQNHYLIEVGGELRMRGRNAEQRDWSIAVEDPIPGSRSIRRVFRISDTAVATSGDYRNFFEYDGIRYSHTIDPRSGSPVTHDGASVTVAAPTAAFADAMATALLVLGPEAGFEFAERHDIAAFFVIKTDGGFADRATSAFDRLASR